MNPPPTGDRAAPSRVEPRPPIELASAVDDRRNPTKVTVYPKHGRELTTSWLTVDIGWVLDLEETV